MSVGVSIPTFRKHHAFKTAKRAIRKIVLLGLGLFFIPGLLGFFLVCGLVDVLRNKGRTFSTLDRYFAGNGVFTWFLSPFNLLMDLLSLPYWNKGIYKITDLPQACQDEIRSIIDAAHKSDLVGKLESKVGGHNRGMIFFKWYGKNIQTSLDVPAFQHAYQYIRTIGVSVFNKHQSTGKHFGPLRVTLRVLYSINTIADKTAYIKVGNHTNYWQENKLFIFDDTCNINRAMSRRPFVIACSWISCVPARFPVS